MFKFLLSVAVIILSQGLITCTTPEPKPDEPDHAETVFVGGSNGYLYAFDAQLGTKKWEVALDNLNASGPSYANGTIFIGSAEKLQAVDATTGTKKWDITLGVRQQLGYVRSIPTVVNGIAYVSVSGYVNKLVAVDVEKATVRWEFDLQSNDISTPTVSEGIVCIGASGKLIGLDALTGSVKWQITDVKGKPTNSSIVDGTVYTNIGGKLYAHDLKTGIQKWQSIIWGAGSPSIEDGYIYIKGDGLSVVEAKTGKYILEYKYVWEGNSNPVVQHGTVYFGSGGAYEQGASYSIHAVNVPESTKKWRQNMELSVASSPTAANDFVYVGTMGTAAKFYAFDALTGELKWSVNPQQTIMFYTPACVVSKKGMIYHTSDSGDQQ